METPSAYPTADIERHADMPKRGRASAQPVAACIADVQEGSPAYDAGFEPGCHITSVNGARLRDIIDWRWHTAGDEIELGYIDLDGESGIVELWRAPGEDWGFEFDGLVFDNVRQCRNACTFCFMRQLPSDMRPSLYLRDDDYRLSFLVGTFVTLTNITPEDEQRIIEQRISPLRVSLQATNDAIRRKIMGKNARHGIEVLERLLRAGIQFHTQIVLVPGENDGNALEETLEWAYAREGILNVGIVPLGYTRFQDTFHHSFGDRASASALLELITPFQQRALRERGVPWVFAADEFYRNANPDSLLSHIPPTEFYGDFSMFEDGIGIIRSTIDDWEAVERDGVIARVANALRGKQLVARMVVGCAQREFLEPLASRSGITDVFKPLYVENAFFGGNVDVTGLLVSEDIVKAIRACETPARAQLFLVPRVIFNDDGLTLDDKTLQDMENEASVRLRMVSCSPIDYFREIAELVGAAE